MTAIQILAVSPPFDRPAVGMRAARLLGLAEAMGLLPPSPPIHRLDREALEAPLRELARHGVGRQRAIRLLGADETEMAEILDGLYAELEASPVPPDECRALSGILGQDLLGRLAGISISSLRRYEAGERAAPDEVAGRVHHLARIVSHLAGGYNEFGIRRWFARPRTQLGSRAPGDLLHGAAWHPDGKDAMAVLQLAEALNSSPAT